MEWISVNDRLPEDNIDVLVFMDKKHKNSFMLMGLRHHKYGWFAHSSCGFRPAEEVDNVTHWMPLPQPPVQKEDK